MSQGARKSLQDITADTVDRLCLPEGGHIFKFGIEDAYWSLSDVAGLPAYAPNENADLIVALNYAKAMAARHSDPLLDHALVLLYNAALAGETAAFGDGCHVGASLGAIQPPSLN